MLCNITVSNFQLGKLRCTQQLMEWPKNTSSLNLHNCPSTKSNPWWAPHLFSASHLNINLLNLHAPTCCHGDVYHPAATSYTGQALWLHVSSKFRLGFLILRHLRSGKVMSFPSKVFSLHFISLLLIPKPQVAEHCKPRTEV